MEPEAGAETPEWAPPLREWRQGDYSLDIPQVLLASSFEDGDLVPVGGEAVGLAVLSQTCDIVNWGPGREYVAVAPLVEASETLISNARRGTSPAFALLENPPVPGVVIDLGQVMSLHKSVLARLDRREGFASESSRHRFADSLARKYGRFAFPDAFAEGVLAPLRKRLQKGHGKDSQQGRAFASIDCVRVVAVPSWDCGTASVGFRFVLASPDRLQEPRDIVAAAVTKLLKGIDWPEGFRPLDPLFTLMTTDEMSASDWIESQEVDWGYISFPKA